MSKKLVKKFSQRLVDGGLFEDIDLAAEYVEKLIDYVNKSTKDIMFIEPYKLSIEDDHIIVDMKYKVKESPKYIKLNLTLSYPQKEEESEVE